MSGQWVVDIPGQAVYGPFGSEAEALAFRDFLADEVDPATVWPLKSPVSELLSWRDFMLSVTRGEPQ